MALTPEQVKILKEQLKSQVHNLPEPKKSEALKQIETLSPQALELMLKQQGAGREAGKEESVFRLIVSGEIPSARIDENKLAIAVLEINPLSQGHAIIIPKQAAKNPQALPNLAFTLAKKVSKRIISKLKAKNTEIQTETKFGETIINVIPVYDRPVNLGSPRKKAEKAELEQIMAKIRIITKPKIEKIRITKQKASSDSQILKLPRKIP